MLDLPHKDLKGEGMKKLIVIAAATASLCLMPVAVSAETSATVSCEGPMNTPVEMLAGLDAVQSESVVTETPRETPQEGCEANVEETNTCVNDTTNNVDSENTNNQNGQSGDAEGQNNGTVGNVGSGDASTDNNTNTNVDITNGNVCGEATNTTTTPTPEPGRGSGATTATPVVASTQVALPDTGNTAMPIVTAFGALASGLSLAGYAATRLAKQN